MILLSSPTPTIAPSVEFERRYALQSLESAVARGEPEIINIGPRGCGKTLGLCDFFYRLARKFHGMTQIWLRDRRTLMTPSVIATFEDEVLGIGHPLRTRGDRDGRNGYDVGDGSRILLMGMDDPDRTKSISADLFWVNECGALSESDWEELGAAARARVGVSRFPFQLKVGDTNPMPPGHWTNRRTPPWPRKLYPRVLDDGLRMRDWFTPQMYLEATQHNLRPMDRVKHQAKLIQWHHADNPGYWSVNEWDWLPPGQKYITDVLGKLTGNRKARYLEGRPVAEEGAVFDDFNRDDHVIPAFDWPKDWPVWIAYDPGYRHPCAVDFVGIAPNGQPFFIDEIHAPGISIERLGPRILEKAARYRVVSWLDDPFGANQQTQIGNGITVRDYMRREFNLHFRPWKEAKGAAKQAQVEALRVWLIQENPLQIFDTCSGIVSNFESWMNKVNRDGSIPEGDERYEDKNNDGIDGLLGIVAEQPHYSVGDNEWAMT